MYFQVCSNSTYPQHSGERYRTNDPLIRYLITFEPKQGVTVTHKSTVARTLMCRRDGRGRFPVLLDDHSKCRTNSQRKSQLS